MKLFKLRVFLIKFIARKDITAVINAKIDSEKGIIIDKNYNVIYNVEGTGFKSILYTRDIKVNVDFNLKG